MKVLWFTSTPSLSSDFLNNTSVGCSWIGALEGELIKVPYIELAIAFAINNSKIKPFTLSKTKYYPVDVYSPKNTLGKLKSRWNKRIHDVEDIQPYLNIIEDFKPDVIHIFGTEEVYGLIASKTKIPCIIHIQGNLISCINKWYSGITELEVIKYSNKWIFLKGYGIIHDYIINKKASKREERIFQGCRYFMGRTDWDKRITSILAPTAQYFHCDEILRPEFYLTQWTPSAETDKFIITTIIRNNIYKGLESIFECKRILNSLSLTKKIIWNIIGITQKDEISIILEKKHKITFKEMDVQLLGPLKQHKLISEMLKSDVFIHPSHIDNSPNSVCEAMLLGMPVISTYAGGIPSIIENNKEGLLVQDGDPYALSGAILELYKNKENATNLGINARKRALERHDSKNILANLVKIYSILKNNNN